MSNTHIYVLVFSFKVFSLHCMHTMYLQPEHVTFVFARFLLQIIRITVLYKINN